MLRLCGLLVMMTSLWAGAAQAGPIGFEVLAIPVAGDRPLQVGVWYPSPDPQAPTRLGLDRQSVALGGALAGRALPLVVISHGAGGWFGSHVDTARALADAGFVVAAVSHTGDTFDDRSRALRMSDRVSHVSATIDRMQAWRAPGAIDPRRIGVFGFSSGGFTGLVAVGAQPDLARLAPHCAAHPAFYDCSLSRQFAASAPTAPERWRRDPRIRAAVIVAPALGFTFTPDGLRRVKVPLQLWRAEKDTILPHPFYAEAVHQALPAADYRLAAGADHFDFLPPCSEALARSAPYICGGGFDRTRFQPAFNAEVTTFFGKTLR